MVEHPAIQEDDELRVDALIALTSYLKDGGYRFITPSPATHARVNNRPVNALANRLEDVFGWSRPFEEGLLPDVVFAMMDHAGVALREGDEWRSAIRVSTLDGLWLMHSAYPTTEADAVFFGPDTYRFGSALRQMMDARREPVRRAVDIGTGSGCAALMIARQWPDAEVWAADINAAALEATQVNASVNGTPNVIPCESNLLAGVEGEFDLIVANPPYLVDASERAYRHGGGPLGAGLSLAIVEAAVARLAPGGTLLLYTGVAIVQGDDPFLEAATPMLRREDITWSYREMDPDIFGEELLSACYAETDRIAAVVLTATRRAA